MLTGHRPPKGIAPIRSTLALAPGRAQPCPPEGAGPRGGVRGQVIEGAGDLDGPGGLTKIDMPPIIGPIYTTPR